MLRHRHHKAVEPEFGHYHHKAEEDSSVCRFRHKAGTKSEEEEEGGLGLFPRNRFILISWIRSFSYTISLPNCKVPASLSGIYPLQLDCSKGMQKGGGSNLTSSFLLAH